MRRILMFLKFLVFFLVLGQIQGGCTPSWYGPDTVIDGIGGGNDLVTVDMPFEEGYVSLCTQCAGGATSHQYTSTQFDVDLDTPNDAQDLVYAPASGVVWVHDTQPGVGFGIHLNLEMADGSFIVLGHMSEVLVGDGEQVVTGQIVGVEGTTGASTGDHVHMGRHTGDAMVSASSSTSIEGLAIRATDTTTGSWNAWVTSEMTCDIPGGHRYRSDLRTPRWHPDGSLLKHPLRPEVYYLQDGTLRHIANEQVFQAYRLSFWDVALASDAELDCYDVGEPITGGVSLVPVYDGFDVWMLYGQPNDPHRVRIRVPRTPWSYVLETWGWNFSSFSQLPLMTDVSSYPLAAQSLGLREGSLVKEFGSSAVYMMSHGIALPIESWDVFLLLDFNDRTIIEMPAGTIRALHEVGDCSTGEHCLTRSSVLTCGGSSESFARSSALVPGWDVSPDSEPVDDPDTGAQQDIDGDGYRSSQGDCDDQRSDVHPGASEVCDSVDNNCDGIVDEDVRTDWWIDADHDGFGNHFLEPVMACSEPEGSYTAVGGDCDDTDAHNYPGNVEVCDHRDNNCNALVDEGCSDIDQDTDVDSDSDSDSACAD